MAKFEKAIEWLRNGKKIRRPSWIVGSYWKIGHNEQICWKDGTNPHIHLNQIEATDWEIYEEELIYKCGHKERPIILDSNELSVSAYLEWKDGAGFGGDKSMCWDCWCDKDKVAFKEEEFDLSKKIQIYQGWYVIQVPDVKEFIKKESNLIQDLENNVLEYITPNTDIKGMIRCRSFFAMFKKLRKERAGKELVE